MLVLLWIWQDAFRQMSLHTLTYSEFKTDLARGEVAECTVGEDEIEGRLVPKPTGKTSAAARGRPKEDLPGPSPFLFRTVRVEDPKLIEQLQAAGVKYSGRPRASSPISAGLDTPDRAMMFLWVAFFAPIGAAGETVLSFGKSRAKLVAELESPGSRSTTLRAVTRRNMSFKKSSISCAIQNATTPWRENSQRRLARRPAGNRQDSAGQSRRRRSQVPFFS